MKKQILFFCTMLITLGCSQNEEAKMAENKQTVAENVQTIAETPKPEIKAKLAESRVVTVDWQKAIEMNKQGAIFIDVRTVPEVKEGMVVGALNFPLQELEHHLNEIPKDKDLLIYCRSGKRSMAAGNFLTEHGFSRVYNVDGGFLAYPKE